MPSSDSATLSHARPSHHFIIPRLILRSGTPSDANAVCIVRSEPPNKPFGGVHEPNLTAEVQAERISTQALSTARDKNAWVQIILIPELSEHVVNDIVEDGILIGMTASILFLRRGMERERKWWWVIRAR